MGEDIEIRPVISSTLLPVTIGFVLPILMGRTK
jgi:hypothetical protein